MAFSVPSRGFIDDLVSQEDEEFDRLLRGGGGLFGESRAPPAIVREASPPKAPKERKTVARDESPQPAPTKSRKSKEAIVERDESPPPAPKERKSRSSSKTADSSSAAAPEKERKSKDREKKKRDRSASLPVSTSAPPPPPPPPKAAPSSAGTSSSGGGFLGELQSRAKKMAPTAEESESSNESGTEAPPPTLPQKKDSKPSAKVVSSGGGGGGAEKKAKKLEQSIEELVQAHNAQSIKDIKSVFNQVFLAVKPKFESDSLFDGEQIMAIFKETMREGIRDWATTREDSDPIGEHVDKVYDTLDALKSDLKNIAKAPPKVAAAAGGAGDSAEAAELRSQISDLEAEISRLEKNCEKLKTAKKTAKRKVEELQVWQGAVPELRKLLEQTVEEKENLKAQAQDLQRLQRGYKLTWVPDAAVLSCLNCDVQFGLTKWKNHCRYCGRVFCWECTARKAEILEFGFNYDVPVCDHCYNLVKRNQSR